jgi:hypothetical protein
MEKKPERQPRSPVEVRTRGKRGPEPERVKIERSWEEAMKKALKAPP